MKHREHFWKKDTPREQRILGVIFLSSFCIAFIQFVCVDNFIPDPTVSLFSFYIAFAISLLFCAAIIILKIKAKQSVGTVVKTMPLRNKLASILILPILLIATYWMLLASVIPYQLTKITGQDFEEQTQVHKVKTRHGRRSFFRDYHYELRLIDSPPIPLFRFSISEHSYNKFPEGNLKATLFGLKGNLGFIVEEIQIDTQD
ncbi:MAG TPA: hypothetical protein EYM37_04355 [Methylophaga aminisulfidivorans]|uniref:hypothetical protein n=1 Tax=Methylophaga TaxID=40222 RepID=UPI00058F1205|nr:MULTISPECIES: hypothetical protein [Methylophaga]HIC47793.1 hypothetical protein [Methylophaga sp.]HIM39153.1 hypothetical protein [Methylophaga aminisulfidivorans]